MAEGHHKATVIVHNLWNLRFWANLINFISLTVVNRHGHFVDGKGQNGHFGKK